MAAETAEPRFDAADVDALVLPLGARAELLDGKILVSPAPSRAHQLTVRDLQRQIADQTGDDVEVIAGVDVGDAQAFLIPDLCVADREAVHAPDRFLPPASVHLVVEVVSPSSRQDDYLGKAAAYRRWGIPAYWVVDPGAGVITVHDHAGDEVRTHPLGDRVVLDIAGRPVHVDVRGAEG